MIDKCWTHRNRQSVISTRWMTVMLFKFIHNYHYPFLFITLITGKSVLDFNFNWKLSSTNSNPNGEKGLYINPTRLMAEQQKYDIKTWRHYNPFVADKLRRRFDDHSGVILSIAKCSFYERAVKLWKEYTFDGNVKLINQGFFVTRRLYHTEWYQLMD
jgi:hypothetical protein